MCAKCHKRKFIIISYMIINLVPLEQQASDLPSRLLPPWLEGAVHPFTGFAVQSHIEYLQEAKRLNSRQAWWAFIYKHFHFMVNYKPGSEKVDALSQQCRDKGEP